MLGWLALHFSIGIIGTWLARQYAVQRELIDQPGERRSHDVPTPRGGGVAIALALLVAACVMGWRQPQQIVLLVSFAVGLLLIAGVGLVDDHRPLSPWLRLGVQGIAASLFALGVAGTWGDLTVVVVAFVSVLVLVNVWNFMDGINGIATSQAALVAGGLALLVGGIWGWIALALTAACLGFLPFNFPRARIFLGDVGSGTLGFGLAALLTVCFAQGTASWPLLLLPLSAFLVDSGLTLLRRVVRREHWWTSHAQHAYQRWAAGAGTHTIVTLAYAGWTTIAWMLVWWLRPANTREAGAFCLAWLFVAIVFWGWLQYSHAPERGRLRAKMEKDRK